MEPKKNNLSDLSQTRLSLTNGQEDQQTFHQRPVEPMIVAEKIHRALSDIQAQILNLRRQRINMGLVRTELANMEAKWAH